MPKIEIEESDLLAHQQLGQVVAQMMANPEARRLVQQARKVVDPNAVIPELDAAKPLHEAAAKTSEEIAALRKQIEDDKAERDREKQLAKFQSEFQAQRDALLAAGYTGEGIDKIIEHAKAHGIGTLEVAAAHWEKLNPPPAPVEPTGAFGTWNFFENGGNEDQDGFVKKLLDTQGNSEAVVDAEARKALADIRGSSRRSAR